MPIHFEDEDIFSEVAELRSALIVPCNLCPAVTVATRQNRPFMRFLRSPVKSAPFEEYLKAMQSRLSEKGVTTKVFRSSLYHNGSCVCGPHGAARSSRERRRTTMR